MPSSLPMLHVIEAVELTGRKTRSDSMVWSPWWSNTRWELFQWQQGLEVEVALGSQHIALDLTPGMWVLYRPLLQHRDRRAPGPCTINMVFLEFAHAPKAWEQITFARINDPDREIERSFRRLVLHQDRLAIDDGNGDDWRLHGVSLELIGRLVEASNAAHSGTTEPIWTVSSPIDVPAPAPDLLARIDSLLEAALDRPPKAEDIAGQLNMSLSSLTHRYRRETGWTLLNRMRWLRVRAAQRILVEEPDLAMKALARRVGFPDAELFSRAFFQVAGVKPTTWRAEPARRQPLIDKPRTSSASS